MLPIHTNAHKHIEICTKRQTKEVKKMSILTGWDQLLPCILTENRLNAEHTLKISRNYSAINSMQLLGCCASNKSKKIKKK